MTEPTTFRLDKTIKAEAYSVFKKLGLKPSQAIQLFLGQVALHKGIPFELDAKVPNEETEAAIYELESSEKLKSYENVEDLFSEIISDEDEDSKLK